MPGFEMTAGEESRLDDTDAEFVDVIHTCAGRAGYMKPLGHVDFYPNGGSSQPGCEPAPDIYGTACSHGRSIEFFAESILSENGFYAYKCKSYEEYHTDLCKTNDFLLMGDPTPTNARGVYYLDTTSKFPYAKGKIK